MPIAEIRILRVFHVKQANMFHVKQANMFHVKHPIIGRWPVRMLPKVVLADGEAESGLNGNPLSKQLNAIRLPTHQVIAKRLRPKRRLVLSACLSSKR